MRIAEVVGNVTLNRWHPALHGANLKLVIPLMAEDLVRDEPQGAETLVAWDELGTSPGMLIAMSEGPEAALPFRPKVVPIDAYATAIIDDLNIDSSLVRKLVQ